MQGANSDPVVSKYIASGLSREVVTVAVANYGDNPTKVCRLLCNNICYCIKVVGTPDEFTCYPNLVYELIIVLTLELGWVYFEVFLTQSLPFSSSIASYSPYM